MAKVHQRQIEQELEIIRQVLQKFPNGADAEEIMKSSGIELESRTLQRRLKTLSERNQVSKNGTTRSAKYYLVIKNESKSITEKDNAKPDQAIHLSEESREILAILSKRLDEREPVDYNRKFVERHRPNKDFYLSKTEREQLANLTITSGGAEQPAGTYAKHILQRLLIDLSWNSSRLEGNTYSLLDTERLLSQGEAAPEKSVAEAQMILNHKEAIEFIVSEVNDIGFNRYSILNIHALLSNDLLPDPAAPGRLRTYAVGIKQSTYTPTAIPQLIEEMFDLILKKASEIENPHEQALFIMIQLPYLQPFEDVNKRVSRLAANIPFNKYNLTPISFIGVPHDLYIQGLIGVYELNRIDLIKDIFIWACIQSANRYAQVRQTISEPDPFRIKYREMLRGSISEIVSKNMSSTVASKLIQTRALEVPSQDSGRFIELIETELLSLHEGNFARYRISPTEFKRWKENWLK